MHLCERQPFICVQVWGVSSEDTLVLVRTGVTPSELAGRTWKPISLPIITCESPSNSGQSSTTSPQSSVSGVGKVTSPDTTTSEVLNMESVEKVLSGLSVKDSAEEEEKVKEQPEDENIPDKVEGGEKIDGALQDESLVPPQGMVESVDSPSIEIKYPEDCSSLESSGMSDHAGEYVASLLASQSSPVNDLKAIPGEPSQQENSTAQKSAEQHYFPPSTKEWSESRLRHASSTSSQGSLGPLRGEVGALREEGPVFNILQVVDDHLWLWVTGGGCWIKANNMPKW